ncbi:MAG TPA: glycosyltransferase family 39 protein [Thermoleophilaceae bacterium]|jgi:4-amino-4-deoxy-L-arabinose transferase-like glycosyltransferase
MRPVPGSFRARLAAVVAAATALRLLYVLVLARTVPMAGDSSFFHGEANLIAEGEGFVEPFVHTAYGIDVATAAHPPLYSLWLSLASLTGADGLLEHRSLGALTGGACIVVIALLGRRVGGERVGLAAAGIAALYPLLVAADGALMSESLYGLLVASALLVALRLHERRDLASAAILGALIGLAALTRGEALLLLVLLALPIALAGGRRRVARAALACAACAAVLAPWTIRNASAFDRLTLIAHNDSTVLAGANCPATYGGRDLGSWRFDCISERRTLREGDQAARWRSEGLDYARDHAGRLALVVPVRVLRTWDLYQPRRQVEFAESRARWAERAGVAAYFLLLPLAVAGGVRLFSRARPALLVLLAPAAVVTISSAVGYGVPRFRHAFEPSLVVLAALGLVALLERRRRRAAAAAAAV